MQDCKHHSHRWLTAGILTGWQVYEPTLHSFFAPLFRGIRRAACDQRCNLLLACGVGPPTKPGSIHPAWPSLSPESDFVPVGPWNTDGLIVVTPLLSETRSRYIQSLIARGHPVVFVGTGEGGPAVVVDNEGGIRQAIAHLSEHGHRRIAFIAGYRDERGASECRLKAYQSAVQEFGLEASQDLILHGFHSLDGGRQAIQQLLDSGVPFTAVLASNDASAFGAIRALNEAGVRIPQDLAVVGFTDRVEAMAQVPSLTTVRYPLFEAGCQALMLLLKYIEEGAKGDEIVKVPTRLVIRESCGCLPGVVIPALPDDLRKQSPEVDPADIKLQVVQAMTEAALGEVRHLSSDEAHTMCWRLVEALALSLEQGDALDFRWTLEEILRRVEAADDDVYAWQAAVSVLESGMPVLLEAWSWPVMCRQAEDMLRQAQIAISERARRRHIRYLFQQSNLDDQVGWMTVRFLAALDETRILEILTDCLPGLGIRRADVAFFEPEDSDPVAWSVLSANAGNGGRIRRFPSRQFPPDGLYPAGEPFSLALLPLVIQEEVVGFVAFDAADLRLCAAIVRQLAAALRSARLYRETVEGRRLAEEGRRLAEEANRMKSRFLSTVSHELRTPLNLVVGLSDMLLRKQAKSDPSLPESYREDLERICTSARHLDGLIQDVLDLARSEVGRLKLVCEPLDLAEVLQSVATVGEQMAQDKGLGWRAEMPEGLPQVWGDQNRLRQVVLNLVSNAVKFTARGEAALEVEAKDGVVTVRVSDTGLGIPVEEQTVIFDEFRQSEQTAARRYGGLGLGLAICRRLVEMHGGELGVESLGEEGAGSTFFFTLPAMGGEVPDAKVSRREREQRVLLLAERAGGGERLREHLAQQGFEVEELWIDEGTGWLSRVLVAPPGVVVLDMEPALERGWEILKLLKGNPATQDIPVLFYSLTQEQDSGAMLEIDYLTKPVGTMELAQALARQGLGRDKGEEAKTILVVDDEPGILEMHARIVQTQLPSCRVLKARDGRETLDVIRREWPDLVLLDLIMPELDGFEVLAVMQEDETTRDIPVIVLTGQVLTQEDMERLNRGVAAVLGKGLFSVEETLAHVEAALTRKRWLGSETQRLVRKAMAYLHEHYTETVSREDVARYVGMSGRHFTRCFRREMDLTPVAYLNRYRVKQAKALLAAGDKSVTEVATTVGFSNASYFCSVFQREVGVSPSAYRRGERVHL